MLIDLGVSEGEWFHFFTSHIDEQGKVVFDDPVKDAKVCIRDWQPFFEQQAASRKRKAEHVLNPSTRQMDRVPYVEEFSPQEALDQRELAYDYAITGLEGFKDKKTKKVIECTMENKSALMRNTVFDRFFAECMRILQESSISVKEGEEKNSLNG